MTAPPAWIDPNFRLIEESAGVRATRPWTWSDLAHLADTLAPALRRAGGRVAVADGRVATLVAALVAAGRAGVELVLGRAGVPEPPGLSARIAADGTVEVIAPAPAPGFSIVLLTSGTTGTPKPMRHDLARLTGRLRGTGDPAARWLLTYPASAFAGLQVVLTALAAGATLIVAPGAGVAGLVRAAAAHGATHVSGTPSFWRAALIAAEPLPPLRAVTLGGEAADPPLLDRLAAAFPAARRRHIYASTEAGALFSVTDGRAGFPAAWLDTGVDGVSLRVRDGVLEVRSPRAAAGVEGWLSTGDLVEVIGDRVLFAGRADGVVNVGGVKVSPEKAEAALLAVPGVAEAAVSAVPSPITGHLLTAAVVPAPGAEPETLRAAIRERLAALAPAERPRRIDLVERIEVGASGKKRRLGGDVLGGKT